MQTRQNDQFKDNIWFSILSGGICRYNGVSFTIYAKKDGLSNIYAQSILQDKQGRIWVGTGAGLFLFDGQRFRNFTKMDFEKL
jgi:ligand-binding sensor domain-containing protein